MPNNYITIMQGEVKADVYSGENCDEITTYFNTYCEGDQDSDEHKDDIVIKHNELPPGATILVQYPCCPECDLPRQEIFKHLDGGRMEIVGFENICECGFNWIEWGYDEYS